MDGMQMLDGMGGIDSKFIEEAEEAEQAQRLSWRGILPLAVAACLCIVAGIVWIKAGLIRESGRQDIARQERQEAYARVANSAETQECQMESQESRMETAQVEASESGKETAWIETVEGGVVTVRKETTESGMENAHKESTDISEENAASSKQGNEEMINGSKQTEWTADETTAGYRIISSYGVSNEEEMAAKTADYAVVNGGCFLSNSLKAALDAYGEEVRYRVVVEIFSEGVQVPVDGKIAAGETERLRAEGYIVAMETLNDGVNTQTLFTLHATAGQLNAFKGLDKYGYGIWLYGEKTQMAVSDTMEIYHIEDHGDVVGRYNGSVTHEGD